MLKHYCIQLASTVVWEKFIIGYFRVKIVRSKIFSSPRVSDENFFNNEVFYSQTFCFVAQELNI